MSRFFAIGCILPPWLRPVRRPRPFRCPLKLLPAHKCRRRQMTVAVNNAHLRSKPTPKPRKLRHSKWGTTVDVVELVDNGAWAMSKWRVRQATSADLLK